MQFQILIVSATLNRLEAATSRLEDIAVLQASATEVKRPSETAVVAPALSNTGEPPSPSAREAVVADPPSVLSFDDGVTDQLKTFLQLSGQLGPVIKEQVRVLIMCVPSRYVSDATPHVRPIVLQHYSSYNEDSLPRQLYARNRPTLFFRNC